MMCVRPLLPRAQHSDHSGLAFFSSALDPQRLPAIIILGVYHTSSFGCLLSRVDTRPRQQQHRYLSNSKATLRTTKNTMAAASKSLTLAQRVSAFINSPTGPKTTHFWGA